MADALFTGTQQRLFGLLFGQPERSFFVTEIIDLAGVGRGAVQRELSRLEQTGLLIAERRGNQKHYRANPKAPIYGSVAKKTDTAQSDIDLLVVADDLTLEDLYSALSTAEQQLGRPVNPTLLTRGELDKRSTSGNPFLERVLGGPMIPLIGELDAA